MKITQISKHIVASSEDGDEMRITYANRGEPYREGCEIQVMFSTDEYSPSVIMFLEHSELKNLSDSLKKLLGDNN